MAARVVTVNELLDGRVALDIECLDRIYLSAYVPILQSSGQVVAFLTGHLGHPVPSPALFNKIGPRFRAAVAAHAEGRATQELDGAQLPRGSQDTDGSGRSCHE